MKGSRTRLATSTSGSLAIEHFVHLPDRPVSGTGQRSARCPLQRPVIRHKGLAQKVITTQSAAERSWCPSSLPARKGWPLGNGFKVVSGICLQPPPAGVCITDRPDSGTGQRSARCPLQRPVIRHKGLAQKVITPKCGRGAILVPKRLPATKSWPLGTDFKVVSVDGLQPPKGRWSV